MVLQSRCQITHDSMSCPRGLIGQPANGSPRFDSLAHALEGLFSIQCQQCHEILGQSRISQQVSTEDVSHCRDRHERCQPQKHEMTLGTLPAPATGAGAIDMEIPIAG